MTNEIIDKIKQRAADLRDGYLDGFNDTDQIAQVLDEAVNALQLLSERSYNIRWIPADANNLPKGKVIYKLYDGRMGIGVLYNYEFFSDDELSVCVRDDYGDHPNVIKWTPLPYQLMEDK